MEGQLSACGHWLLLQRTWFNSQHPHDSSHPCNSSSRRSHILCSMWCTHTYLQGKHTHYIHYLHTYLRYCNSKIPDDDFKSLLEKRLGYLKRTQTGRKFKLGSGEENQQSRGKGQQRQTWGKNRNFGDEKLNESSRRTEQKALPMDSLEWRRHVRDGGWAG